jgi:5-methyltetrahydropteroyltriglutamate--homocysteine methyltransferase
MSAACSARWSCGARAACAAGGLTQGELREVEDRCIRDAIAQQERIGLRAATDGEYRRAYWHYDFVSRLAGVELYVPEEQVQFSGGV